MVNHVQAVQHVLQVVLVVAGLITIARGDQETQVDIRPQKVITAVAEVPAVQVAVAQVLRVVATQELQGVQVVQALLG